MKKRSIRTAFVIAVSTTCVLLTVLAAAFLILGIRTASIRDGHHALYEDEKYQTPVSVEGIEVITQNVSCGYAVLEMFSAWSGHDVTEESLYAEYGRVTTSTGRAFCAEMNRQFPEYKTEIHRYLTDTELLELAYENLENGIPVPFEWAAPYDGEWTLHYSLITGMDIPGDRITVANPYGFREDLTIDEFLSRTRFDAFENMPLFLKLGFAFGVFEKNTVFSVR